MKLEDVLNSAVAGGNAEQPVKLGSLVSLQRTTTAVEIDHVSLRRVFDVRAGIEDRSRRDAIADIRKMIEELKVPKGVEVKLVD